MSHWRAKLNSCFFYIHIYIIIQKYKYANTQIRQLKLSIKWAFQRNVMDLIFIVIFSSSGIYYAYFCTRLCNICICTYSLLASACAWSVMKMISKAQMHAHAHTHNHTYTHPPNQIQTRTHVQTHPHKNAETLTNSFSSTMNIFDEYIKWIYMR